MAKRVDKKKSAEKLPAGVCPTHHEKLIPTRTTGELVCPNFTCNYWRKA